MAEKAKTGSRCCRLVGLTAAVLGTGAIVVCRAQPAPDPATAEQWTIALTALRQIAMDAGQDATRRGNAIMAYAKLQSMRGRHDEGIQTCWEVLSLAKANELADAAVRAACFCSRQAHGHLGGPVELVKAWQGKVPAGPGRGALTKAQQDLIKMQQYAMGIAAKKMPPMPVRATLAQWALIRPKSGVAALNFPTPRIVTPGWMKVQKDRGPPALQVGVPKIPPSPMLGRDQVGVPAALRLTLPVYTSPAWYRGVQFPLLKEPKK